MKDPILGTDQVKENTGNKTEVVADQIRNLKPVHSIMYRPGQPVFELDFATNEIRKVEFESVDHVVGNDVFSSGTRRKINERDNCWYAQALNYRNAVKHFSKRLLKIYGFKVPENFFINRTKK